MGYGLKELATVADLDAAVSASATQPILIYKHSLTCGTSGMAYEELLDVVTGSMLPGTAFMVTIQTARGVSRAIEERLRIRHESPQVLLVSEGRVVWHASHFRVTARRIAAALQAVSSEHAGK
ncbi:MAG: bacillithiol system redox-active protein YtxJ [Vicinamibacterales bacterium]